MNIKKRLHSTIILTALAGTMVLSFTACSKPKNNSESEKKQQQVTQTPEQTKNLTFDEFLESIYVEDLSSDFSLYSQFVQNPNNYGITEYSKAMTSPKVEIFDEGTRQCEDRLAKLEQYDYNSLTDKQKMDYDTIKEMLEDRIAIKDCAYYVEPLSTTDGQHIVAPGMTALYASRFFETLEQNGAQDIPSLEKYFDYYEALGNYFKDTAEFERDKAKHKTFMTRDRAKKVISVCSAVVNNKGSEFSTIFEDYLLELPWVTDEQKKTLIAKNDELVKTHIVGGYQAIIDAMNDCMGDADQFKGYYETEEGKKYYEYLIKVKTSSDIAPLDMAASLEEHIKVWNQERSEILKREPQALIHINKVMAKYNDPDKLAAMLIKNIKTDFPDISINWGVGKMPQSLNGFAAGLFYPPAFDSTVDKETVYAGTMLTPGTSSYVQTIAHEGLPGHLYHYSYMKTLDLSSYRRLLAWSMLTGYLEGWTTYIEEFAYRYAGLNEDQARILELQRIIELAVIQRVDVGVNYEGWTIKEVNEFLKEYAPTYLIMSSYVVNMAEDCPGMTSSYVVGYIYLTDIKVEMKKKMGDSFTEKAFHEQYLNVGPASYERIRRELGLN